ncbi:MAG: type II toxin-antitoxin system RelE/ParE family toxin [Pirellulaceae bacterium]
MTRYSISWRARGHLKAIWKYVAQHSQSDAVASRVISQLLDRFRFLSANPGVGTRRDDIAPGVRIFSTGAYVVYFLPKKQGVSIAAVYHGARDHEAAFLGGE